MWLFTLRLNMLGGFGDWIRMTRIVTFFNNMGIPRFSCER